jgi:hypothetical protein
MLSAVTDNVISLLASLGFDDSFLGDRTEIVIDSFDQWSNPDCAVAACSPTNMDCSQFAGAAA